MKIKNYLNYMYKYYYQFFKKKLFLSLLSIKIETNNRFKLVFIYTFKYKN